MEIVESVVCNLVSFLSRQITSKQWRPKTKAGDRIFPLQTSDSSVREQRLVIVDIGVNTIILFDKKHLLWLVSGLQKVIVVLKGQVHG